MSKKSSNGFWNDPILVALLIFVVGGLIAAVQMSKSLFGLEDTGIAAEIAFKIIAEASIVIILALITGRYLSTFFIVGIPGSYYWLQPLVNYKAMQVYNLTGTIPFYGTENGNWILAVVLGLLGFGSWALKIYKD
ncbi:hypothetical protein [Acinetobacter calcoaceticus]|uniref:hypothetical protein n=1 Tax=Acinetobacter calcoaceticus TaxID=471 RepID=UPI003008D67D